MSNGELNASDTPWGEIIIDPAMLQGAVAKEMVAVEDAQGDVKAANQRMREAIRAAQDNVDSQHMKLGDRQLRATERLRQMRLAGRPIYIASGTSLAAVNSGGLEDDSTVSLLKEDLTDTQAVITDYEVGAIFGKPLVSADTIVLCVEPQDAHSPLQYAIDANNAEYVIGEIPRPEQ